MPKYIVTHDSGSRDTIDADTFFYGEDSQTLSFTKDVGDKRKVVMFYPNPKTIVKSVKLETE
jgi:hypothetical protein